MCWAIIRIIIISNTHTSHCFYSESYNYTIGPTIQVRMIDIKKSCIPSEEGIGAIKNGPGKFKIKNRTMEA